MRSARGINLQRFCNAKVKAHYQELARQWRELVRQTDQTSR